MINNLAPSNFNNPNLTKAVPVVSNLDTLNYYENHFSPNDINNLLSLLYNNNQGTYYKFKDVIK